VGRHVKNIKEKIAEIGYPMELVEQKLQICLLILLDMDLLRHKPVYPNQDCPVLQTKFIVSIFLVS
jgi:hypothetical protein